MTAGVNLHDVVRGAITFLHPDETVTLYRAMGQVNDKGIIRATYQEPVTAKAQIQSSNKADLALVNNVDQAAIVMRFYMYVNGLAPASTVRPFVRTGDMVQRANGTWWLMTATPENFTDVGWVLCLGTLQELPPEGIDSSKESEGSSDEIG